MRPASILFSLLLSVVLFAGYAVSDDDVDADYYYSRGYSYDSNGVYPEAAKWYLKAAELGHAGGQNMLAVMYFSGIGVLQDWNEAAKWARLAVDQGYADAQANLGFMYQTGKGSPKNHAEAEKLYLMAAKQGLTRAMRLLAKLREEQGNFSEAIAWAWVAMTLAKDYNDERTSLDLRTEIARRDEVTSEDIDRAEALANSLLETVQ